MELTADAADDLLRAAHLAERDQARSRFRPGTIVRQRNGTTRGVVVKFYAEGDRNDHVFAAVGDMVIQPTNHRTTVHLSNRYDEWEVVPPAERTRAERILAVVYTPEAEPEPDGWLCEDETLPWRLAFELADMLGIDPIYDDHDWPRDVRSLALSIADQFRRTGNR